MQPLQFLLASDVSKNSSKSHQIFGILLCEDLLPRTFKNRPIWSHCSACTNFASVKQVWQAGQRLGMPEFYLSHTDLMNTRIVLKG